MPEVVDLGELGSVGSAIIGEHAHDQLGLSVSAAGDVNGDGIDDVIISGNVNDTYVVFGQAGGIGDVDLDDLQPSQGFELIADAFGLVMGPSVSGAGDINGDGFDDLIVGGYQYAGLYDTNPNAFVVFGKAGEFADINIDDFFQSATSDGFRIFGEMSIDDISGARVASAGDFNGDGFDDILFGTLYPDGIGAAYVIFGKPDGFENIDLASLAPGAGFAILGANLYDLAGYSVSGAGDVNGDGLDDIIIGAPYANEATGGGEAYVIFGKETGFDTIDLSNLAPGAGFIIQGKSGSTAGWSVSGAGDVNGDGFDDVIVGAPYADGGAGKTATVGAGEAYIIFGKAGDFGTIDLSRLKRQDGFTIEGDEAGDLAGWSVSGAGDLNNDGFDEFIVGAPGGDGGGVDAGEVYVFFGKAHGFRTIDLGKFEAGKGRSDGFIIEGDVANDRAGWSVSRAGDVDGDGVDDLIVGAPWNDLGAIGEPPSGFPTLPENLNSGQVYVLYGAELADLGNLPHGHGQGPGSVHSDLFW
jgi:hypothetical protein